MFAIQDEISRSIVEALRPALLGDEQHELVKAPTRSLETYDHYLRGRHYWEGRYEKGLETALSYFEKAVEIDPEYALPHTGVADSYAVLGMYGYLRPEGASERAKSRTPYLSFLRQAAFHDPLWSDPRFTELASQVGSGVVATGYDLVNDG